MRSKALHLLFIIIHIRYTPPLKHRIKFHPLLFSNPLAPFSEAGGSEHWSNVKLGHAVALHYTHSIPLAGKLIWQYPSAFEGQPKEAGAGLHGPQLSASPLLSETQSGEIMQVGAASALNVNKQLGPPSC